MQGQARPSSAALGIQLHHGPHWRIPFLAKIRPGVQQLMKPNYRAFFALTREPSGSNLALKEIIQTAEVLGVAKRFATPSASAHWPGHRKYEQREVHRLALGRQQPALIRVSDHMGHRLTGLHPETLQANLRRARSGHRQLFQGRPHQAHQKTGSGDRPGPQEETRPHHR
ncbi:hypothetical protein DFAR_2120011 [Desulfarculales bacterium]